MMKSTSRTRLLPTLGIASCPKFVFIVPSIDYYGAKFGFGSLRWICAKVGVSEVPFQQFDEPTPPCDVKRKLSINLP